MSYKSFLRGRSLFKAIKSPLNWRDLPITKIVCSFPIGTQFNNQHAKLLKVKYDVFTGQPSYKYYVGDCNTWFTEFLYLTDSRVIILPSGRELYQTQSRKIYLNIAQRRK